MSLSTLRQFLRLESTAGLLLVAAAGAGFPANRHFRGFFLLSRRAGDLAIAVHPRSVRAVGEIRRHRQFRISVIR